MFLVLFDASEVQRSVEGCTRPCGVDLLGGSLGRDTEGGVVGNAVAVAVCSDHTRGPAPGDGRSAGGIPSAFVHGTFLARAASKAASARASISSSRSSRAARISASIVPCTYGMGPAMSRGGLRVRPDPAGRAVAPLDPVVKDGSDVVGIAESARCDEAW